jgi:hypothetical protein
MGAKSQKIGPAANHLTPNGNINTLGLYSVCKTATFLNLTKFILAVICFIKRIILLSVLSKFFAMENR